MRTTEQIQTNNIAPKRRRRMVAPLAAAAAVAAAGGMFAVTAQGDHGHKSETVGKVPGVEACAPADGTKTKTALGNACLTAIKVAGDVVSGKAPAAMHVTDTSHAFGITLGQRSYTISQKLAGDINPMATQEYRVSFGINAKGKADLSHIIEEVAVNEDHLAIIDREKVAGQDVYVAGYHDSDAPDQPVPANNAIADQAAASALAAFQPPKQ